MIPAGMSAQVSAQDLDAVRLDVIDAIGTYLELLRSLGEADSRSTQRELLADVHDTTWALSLVLDKVARRYHDGPEVTGLFTVSRALHDSARALWLRARDVKITLHGTVDADELLGLLQQTGLYGELGDTWRRATGTSLPAWPCWPSRTRNFPLAREAA